ncbi:MAG TPA: TonB-dependent receptor [Pyrinomonadaceae bacterium]|jgi:outer membrane receptor protein involved in Fe transport|nr:TonB-dependent receptor [Pyrinomonadaceae bacterium]
MLRSKLSLLVLSLFFFAALSTEARAQAVYGSIAGTVTDAQGAVVPDATVTITSVERNTSDTVQTNESGLYVKDRLLPGKYRVTIEKSGFKKGEIAEVDVGLDRQTQADVALTTGEVTETVTVAAGEGIELKTDRADVATTFEARQVTDLPILDRNFTKLILLTPGATQQQWSHAASENPQGSTQTLVNGQTFAGTGYQLDGTDNRDPILGIIVINPNFEAIGETKITSQNYDAEFGQAIAGVASVQTKSGTDEFHGSLFEFRQNDVLQARNPFAQSQPDAVTGKLIPDTLKNQFGGSIGGPIVRGRAFFFGDYQGTRSKLGGSRRVTVPTLLARSGNFSEYLPRQIFDPITGLPFPGNIIPPAGGAGCGVTHSCLSQEALNVLSLIPGPSLPGTVNNLTAAGSELFDNDTFDVRIDNRATDSINIFGRYSFADYTRNGPSVFGQGGGRELVTLGGSSKVRNQSLALGFDYTLNPTTVIDMRFGYFKYKVNVLPVDFGQDTSAAAGIPGVNLDDFSSGLSEFEIQGPGDLAFNAGSGLNTNRCNCPLDEDESQYQVVANLSKLWGNHSLKFGIDVRRATNLRVPSDEHRSGHFTFSPNRTANGGVGGIGLATFLIGDVTSFSRYISTATDAGERQWRHFYYAQDTWRVTPKLTIAYGLRLDIINPQAASGPGKAGFPDLETGEILVAGVGDVPLNGGVENSLNWAPRLGITYQLTPKTVLRLGYGRSYDIGVFGSVFGHTVTQNLPVLATQQLSGSNGQVAVFNLGAGPPAFNQFFGLSAPPNAGGVPLNALPSSGHFFLPNGVRPRAVRFKQTLPSVDAWNVTVQHQLTSSLSLEVAYVGNKGTHMFAGNNPDENVNQPSITGFGVLTRDQRKPFFQRFGWTQDVLLYCNCSDNHYDSLQVKLTKRFSDGYSLLTHYTLQRARDYNDDRFIPGIDADYAYGPEDFIRTHNFVLSQVAELPFGRGKRFFTNAGKGLNYLVGGWQFNSNTIIQSGLPFNVHYDNGGVIDVGDNRPNVNGEPRIIGSRDQWFDPTTFSTPAVGNLGNLPRNALRGPGYWRTDASLFKKFQFSETKELEFRIEAVNVFNHVNLENPDSNIGNPASPNANAGKITSTAFFGNDLQRNFQFGVKFKF